MVRVIVVVRFMTRFGRRARARAGLVEARGEGKGWD